MARVFHGLATPAYPADQWAKCGFWGCGAGWDFTYVSRLAARELDRLYAAADAAAAADGKPKQAAAAGGKKCRGRKSGGGNDMEVD